MARKAEDVQIQLVVPASLRRAIQKAALDHQDDVDRERLMNRGPMITYVMRWFLTLPKSDQLGVILAGKAIEDAEKEGVEPPKGRSRPAAVELTTTHVPIYGGDDVPDAKRRVARSRKK